MNTSATYLSFTFSNSESRDIVVVLEPEAFEFILPPGEEIEVRIGGGKMPLSVKADQDNAGKTRLAFWHHEGDYQIFYHGKNLLG